MGSQSETLFLDILNVQKILVGWTTFFFLAQKVGRNSYKNTLYISRLWENSDEQNWDKQNKTKIKGKVDVTYKDKNAHSEVWKPVEMFYNIVSFPAAERSRAGGTVILNIGGSIHQVS